MIWGLVMENSADGTKGWEEFNKIFYEQVPAILLYQTIGRHYEQRWVRGWYHNPNYPGTYFYPLWKE